MIHFTRRLAALLVVPLLLVALAATARAETGAAVSEPAWGVLAGTCDAARNTVNAEVGVRVVVVEAYWDRFAPQRSSSVDGNYVAALQRKVGACLDAGFRVVLGTGSHYAPAWVRALPGATYVDQRGKPARNGAVDFVFSGQVRTAHADYLRRLVAALPVGRIEAVRVGTSNEGELGFPGPNEARDGFLQSWWAFGAAPQKGTGLASGMSRSPLPGWVPGARTWNGRTVTADAVRAWHLWYSRSLVQTLKFQADTLRAAGFRGAIHVPAAGRGVLGKDLTAAVTARLDGTGDRDSSLGRGLNYVDQFPRIAATIAAPVVIDLTSVDDATAVAARRLATPQDACRVEDATLSTRDTVATETWSNLRFARAQVARAGLPAVGENPGPPAPQTGGTALSDPEAEQIRRSPGYARGCALAAFYLAFEEDLHTGRSGVTAEDYRTAIAGGA